MLRHGLEMIDQGYTVVPEAVSRGACDRALEAFGRWCEERRECVESHRGAGGHLPRLVNFHSVSSSMLELFTKNDRALAVQDFCFGYRTALYTSLFFEKGSAQGIHRDLPYFRTEPPNFYFGMWVALEDVDAENGPLVVVAGGHRIPHVDPHAIAASRLGSEEPIQAVCPDLWRDYQGEVVREVEKAGLETQVVLVRKGDTVLWHPLTPHGGATIADTGRTRFSAVFHTTPENVPVYQGDVFFDARARPSPDPGWGYHEVAGRAIADLSHEAHFG